MENNQIQNNEQSSVMQTKKGISLIRFFPSIITMFAFCSGLTAIKFALFDNWSLAVLCVFISALLDLFDGKVARLLGQSSQIGAELDSLSDLVCFGVAPGIIAFLSSLYMLKSIGWGIIMFFSVCCILRLARFNVMQKSNTETREWSKKYFIGVPAPSGAILALFPLILFLSTNNYLFLSPVFVSFFLIIAGICMISNFRTFSSKILELYECSLAPILLITAIVLICLITELWLTLLTLIIMYIVSIPCGHYYYLQDFKKENNPEIIDETIVTKDTTCP